MRECKCVFAWKESELGVAERNGQVELGVIEVEED
jgi:hypothetical protein